MIVPSFSVLAVSFALAVGSQDRLPVRKDEPAQATFAVDVEFRTQLAYEDGAPAAPGITLELGVGHKADPQLHLDRPVLARLMSDEDGFVRATLDVPVEWKDDTSAWIWARVETPGYVRRTMLRTLRPGLDTKVTKVAAYPGGTLLGSARFTDGRPVEEARVWLFRTEEGRVERVQGTRTKAGGRFSVNFGGSGDHVLHVRAGGPGFASGSGRSETLALDPLTPFPSVEVEVGGGALLSGRVIDPQGAPVPGARILAVPAGNAACPDEVTCYLAEGEGGLSGGLALSDRSGRFELQALAPGSYDFYGAWTDRDGDGLKIRADRLGVLLATHAVSDEPRSIELIFQTHRIEVVVEDAEGKTADFFVRDEDGKAGSGKLLLLPAEGGERAWDRAPIVVEDLAVFPVEPDRDYVLSWTDPGVPYLDRRVSVPWSRCRTRVDLELGQRARPSTLTVRVLDPDGNPGPGEPRISILSAETRRELSTSIVVGLPARNLVRNSTWSMELPSGRFIVRTNAEPLLGCVISLPLPRATFAPVEAQVVLGPEEERTIELRLRPAGHLDFESLDDPGGPTIEDCSAFFDPENASLIRMDLARPLLGGGFVTLTSTTGERLARLSFEVPGAPVWDLDWIVPGWSSRCLTPIPPGAWTMRVEGVEGLLFEKQIVIEAGQATVVRW